LSLIFGCYDYGMWMSCGEVVCGWDLVLDCCRSGTEWNDTCVRFIHLLLLLLAAYCMYVLYSVREVLR